ncbi:unnamed protein product [Penicillium nalgiovense]|nr:unnamed protein product [Penicillium nalgiovense]
MYSASKLVDYPNKIPQFDSIFGSFAAINNNTQSEDCLTLNVWSKPDPNQFKPIYVNFYGGIVVTVNYRMNIFGFPGLSGHPPNLGLLDQRWLGVHSLMTLSTDWKHWDGRLMILKVSSHRFDRDDSSFNGLASTLVDIGLDNHPSVSFVDTTNSTQRCAALLAQI